MKIVLRSFLCLFSISLLAGCEKSASDPLTSEPPVPPVAQAPTGHITFINNYGTSYSHLVIAKADSSDTRILLKDTLNNGNLFYNDAAKWSFDKTKIVFTSNRDNGMYDLFSINSDGTGLKNLTNTPTKEESFPCLSPDGQNLLYIANDPNGRRQLFISALDGSSARQLTNFTHPTRKVKCMLGIWSYDGTKVYFQADKDTTLYNIYSMKADGTELKRITTNTQYSDWLGSVSRTGKIVYFKSTASGYRIFTINEDGTGDTQATNIVSTDPAISPDGNYVAFISNKDKASNSDGQDVYIVKADGTGLKRLTNTLGNKFFLDWK